MKFSSTVIVREGLGGDVVGVGGGVDGGIGVLLTCWVLEWWALRCWALLGDAGFGSSNNFRR